MVRRLQAPSDLWQVGQGARTRVEENRQRVVQLIGATIGRPMATRRLLNQILAGRLLRQRLKGRLAALPKMRIEHSTELSCRFDCILRRVPEGMQIVIPSLFSDAAWLDVGTLGAAYVYWLSRCPAEVRELHVTLSDGDRPTEGRFAPSTNLPHIVALPDPYYFRQRGFAQWRQLAEASAVDWNQRRPEIVWRGATTGPGSNDPAIGLYRPDLATDRLRLCLALRNVPGTDVRFSKVVVPDIGIGYLDRFGLAGPPVPEDSWLNWKFAIDVDGYSNTWSNFIVRLHLGCCVLKVASGRGYRQWYYGRLRPWEHYVPVSADLSDLMDRIEWVRSNEREAAAIARRGQEFARTLDWETVEAEAVALIAANWNR